MATHASILAWRIPWTEEPSRLWCRGLQESDTTQRLNHHHHTDAYSFPRLALLEERILSDNWLPVRYTHLWKERTGFIVCRLKEPSHNNESRIECFVKLFSISFCRKFEFVLGKQTRDSSHQHMFPHAQGFVGEVNASRQKRSFLRVAFLALQRGAQPQEFFTRRRYE